MSPKQLTIVTLPAGTSTLHEQQFCFGQDNPLKLPYSHIACEGTSPLHELPFCVGQDPSLKVAFGHIASKSTSPLNCLCWARFPFDVALQSHCLLGTSPIHELLFFVGQDSPLKFPYGHIAYKVTSPLHELMCWASCPFEFALW